MASETDIANLAYSHFGQDANIADFNEGSAESDIAQRFYPIARNELLEEFDWTFARKYDTLATLTNDREDWEYRYAKPSDLVLARRVLPSGYDATQNDAADYEIVGDSIYSNEVGATLVYTKLLTDTTKFSPLFTVALTYRCAAYFCGPIVKDPTGALQRSLRAAGDAEAIRAKVSDANSDRARAAHTSTAQRVR